MKKLMHRGSLHNMYHKTHSKDECCDRQTVPLVDCNAVSAPLVDCNAANDELAGSEARRSLMQLREMAAALRTPEPSRTRTQPIPISCKADELDAASPSDMSLDCCHHYMCARPPPHAADDASKRVSRRWRRSTNIVSPASSGHACDAMDEADAENDPHHDHELCSSCWENMLIFEMSM